MSAYTVGWKVAFADQRSGRSRARHVDQAVQRAHACRAGAPCLREVMPADHQQNGETPPDVRPLEDVWPMYGGKNWSTPVRVSVT